MPPPVTAPINLFPPAPGLAFAIDPKLNGAVGTAVSELTAARKSAPPFAFAIIDLAGGTSTGTLKCGGHKHDEVHYVASIAKVAALYAAHALRDMVQRYAISAKFKAWSGKVIASIAGSKPDPVPPLLKSLRTEIDPAVDTLIGGVLATAVRREHRIPHYEQVLNIPGPKQNFPPDFKGSYLTAMTEMIVPSSNPDAGRCIRGIGYGYLNGALEAAGLYDRATQKGIWLAGDFVGTWPYARIASVNDGDVAQAGTAFTMAKLIALIVNGAAVAASTQMKYLKDAAEGKDIPWLTRPDAFQDSSLAITPRTKVTHAKLGLGPLKKGGDVYSEIFRVEDLGKPGRSYAVAFQNLNFSSSNFDEVAKVLRRSIELYER